MLPNANPTEATKARSAKSKKADSLLVYGI